MNLQIISFTIIIADRYCGNKIALLHDYSYTGFPQLIVEIYSCIQTGDYRVY